MKKWLFSHFGFTLVEIIVGITISMILMVGVGVFVSGGMQNIFLQQKVFENASDFTQFNANFQSSLSNIDASFSWVVTSSGAVFKTNKYFWNGGFSYIWTASQESFYCSGTTTNHLFIQHFIPYSEDATDTNFYESSDSGYTAYAKRHIIRDSGGNIVVWKETFWDQLWEFGTGTFLHHPTWLASSGSILFISDTLNNRVLAYNSDDESITILLDETDGLDEPTGLFYDTPNTTLYIANSSAGEILAYSSKINTNYPDALLAFTGAGNNINSFVIEPYQWDNIVDIGLEQNNFQWLSTTNNFFENNEYMFVNYNGSQFSWSSCNSWDKQYNSGNPQRCMASGTGQNSTPTTTTLDSITLASLWSVSQTWSYYFKLELSNGYENIFPYFTQWDGNLLTKDDNTLEVIESWLNYPVNISWTNIPDDVEEFDMNALTDYTFSGTYDSVLETPIDSLNISIDNNLLTLSGSYYKSYDCYNEDIRVTRDFIWKKSLR